MTTGNNGALDGARRITGKFRDLTVDGGLPGAPLGFRMRGATVYGPPQTGTWRPGDQATAQNGTIWICTAGGTPGTWAQAGAARWISVLDYGADPSGKSDSTAAIQDALTAATAAGDGVFMPAGTYATSAPLTVPASVTLLGSSAVNPYYSGDKGAVIKPRSSFAGSYAIYLTDSGATQTPGPALRGFAVDGTSVSGTLHGIYAFGPVYLARLSDLWIVNCTGWGILTAQDSGVSSGATWPFWWWARDIMVEECGAGGISLTSMTDSTWDNAYVIYCGKGGTPGPGWYVDWAGNSQFANCRGEWCGTNGWHLTGSWWTGTGSGGMTMTGCSTDRNEKDGVLIDATGNGPLLIDTLMLRRDGRNGGSAGSSYSGLNINAATIPVTIGTISVYPGVDDNGSGTNSPEYGITLSGSTLITSIGSGYVQGGTTAVNNTATGSYVVLGPGIITATGTPASPGSYAGGIQTGTYTFQASSATFEGGPLYSQDSVDIYTAGQGLKVAEGSNAKQGTAGLTACFVTVANTSVTSGSRIFLTCQAPGGAAGALYVYTRAAGTSFTVHSTSGTDTSTFAYEIVEPG